MAIYLHFLSQPEEWWMISFENQSMENCHARQKVHFLFLLVLLV